MVNSTIFCEICCSEDVCPENQARCMVGHTFCTTCAKTMAEQQIVRQKAFLPCLSSDDCTAQFSRDEARRFLSEEMFDIWQGLAFNELRKELKINLELCDFCDYKCVMTGEYDFGIFMCGNPKCGKWSCRTCRKEDHTPLTCQQSLETLIKNDKGHIEKYLSESIIRHCPNKSCFTPIEKKDGCNHMTCERCGTEFCYLCRTDISGSVYLHFSNSGCKQFMDATPIIAKELEQANERLKDDKLQIELKRKALEEARKRAHAKQEEHIAKQKKFEAGIQACLSKEFKFFSWYIK